jgi:small-conductance mechanosensitive channel
LLFSEEGIVQSWDNREGVLKSLDGKSLMIIQHPNRDILAIQVILVEQNIQELKNKTEQSISKTAGDIIKSIQNSDSQEIINDHIKTIAELKKDLDEQERKIVAEKLKDHYIGSTGKAKYELPGFCKK